MTIARHSSSSSALASTDARRRWSPGGRVANQDATVGEPKRLRLRTFTIPATIARRAGARVLRRQPA